MVSKGIAVRLFRAGFRDLVSVIPPDGELSPNSSIRPYQRGKCPGLLSGKTWRGYPFTKFTVTEPTARQWDEQSANIGLLGHRFPALDVDVDDPKLAQAIQAFAQDTLGVAPVRHSREPRRLLVYRCDEPFGRIAAIVSKDGKSHLVEFLGKGHQYLVHGRHPAGVDYRWEGAPLWEHSPEDLPVVSAASVREFFDKLKEALATYGITCELVGDAKSVGDAPDQDTLFAPSIKKLEGLMAFLPNGVDVDRGEYVKTACAIKAAWPDDPDRARELFLDWAERWEGKVDPIQDEQTWDSLEPPFRVGWSWLQEQAQEGGKYCSAQDDFDAVEGSEPPDGAGPLELMKRAVTLAESLNELAGERLSEVLTQLGTALSQLPSKQQRIVEALALGGLRKRVGSEAKARSLFRQYAPCDDRSAFTHDDTGGLALRQLTAEDVNVEARYLVEGRVPAAAAGALISDFSLGKTWLVIDLGLSVAFGRDWLGSATNQQPVIFLIAEGNRDFPMRLFGWLVEHGLLPESATTKDLFQALEGRVVVNKYPARFDDPDFEEGIRGSIERVGAGLVIIDTLGKTLGGEQSENDNDVANQITGMFSRIAIQADCTTIFTHHVGHRDDGRARGASAWAQGLDFEYVIKGKREELDDGQPLTLTTRKMRDGPMPTPVGFRLKKLRGLSLAGANGAEATVFGSAAIEFVKAPQPLLGTDARVFHFVEENPGCTKLRVRAGVFGGHNKVDRALEELMQKGAIENQGSGSKHGYHAEVGWRVDDQGAVACSADDFTALAVPDAGEESA